MMSKLSISFFIASLPVQEKNILKIMLGQKAKSGKAKPQQAERVVASVLLMAAFENIVL